MAFVRNEMAWRLDTHRPQRWKWNEFYDKNRIDFVVLINIYGDSMLPLSINCMHTSVVYST